MARLDDRMDAQETHFDRRMDNHEARINDVAANLTKHVSECAAIQKKVLWIGGVTLGWVVGHSPEMAKVFIGIKTLVGL